MDVKRKDIKNVHLSVYPPTGTVRISAPLRMGLDTIRLFAASKIGWIRQQQRTLREQDRESPREYLDREGHYVWGQRYLMQVVEASAFGIEVRHSKLILSIRPGTGFAAREEIISGWYRQLIRDAAPKLFAEWGARLGVVVSGFYVRRMKTRWGSCNPKARTIRLNTALATKPRECLDYIVAHELAHLVEPKHGPKFISTMDSVMPDWRDRRALLNRLPARHERWDY